MLLKRGEVMTNDLRQEEENKLYETAYGLISADELNKIEREVNY